MDDPAQQLDLILSSFLTEDETAHAALPCVLQLVSAQDILTRLYLTANAFSDDTTRNPLETRAVSSLRKWSTRLGSLVSSKIPRVQWTASCLIRITADQAYSSFQKDVRGWCNGLLSALKMPGNPYAADIIGTITTLLVNSKPFPALQRDLNQMYLAKLITAICDVLRRSETPEPSLFAHLQTIIDQFPNAVKSQFEKIEILCLQSITRTGERKSVIRAATACLVALGKINKDNAGKPFTTNIIDRICASIEDVLDTMFSCLDDEHTKEPGTEALILPAVTGESPQLPERLGQLSALATCLCTIISIDCIRLRTKNTVKVIRRIYLNMSRLQLTNRTDDPSVRLLRLMYPNVCVLANDILAILIQRNALSDVRFVWTICGKALEMSGNHRALRLSAYRLVEKSILTFGGEILRLAASSLFKEIMEDMSLHNSVSREVHVTQQTSKKRKLETVENKTNVEPADTWDLRRTALGVLELLITSGQAEAYGVDLTAFNRIFLSSILATTIKRGPSLQVKSVDEWLQAYQYQSLKCLLASLQCCTGKTGDILALGIKLFANFLHHPNIKIRLLCKEALRVTELLIHPRLPRFQYTSPIEDHSSPKKGDVVLDRAPVTFSSTIRAPLAKELASTRTPIPSTDANDKPVIPAKRKPSINVEDSELPRTTIAWAKKERIDIGFSTQPHTGMPTTLPKVESMEPAMVEVTSIREQSDAMEISARNMAEINTLDRMDADDSDDELPEINLEEDEDSSSD